MLLVELGFIMEFQPPSLEHISRILRADNIKIGKYTQLSVIFKAFTFHNNLNINTRVI